MSLLSRQIRAALERSFEKDENGFKARLCFDNDFVGFGGHFPDNPVLPGIVLIQSLVLMCEKCVGETCRIKCIREAKFTEPVLPNQSVTVVSPAPEKTDRGETLMKGVFYKEEKPAAKIALLLDLEDPSP